MIQIVADGKRVHSVHGEQEGIIRGIIEGTGLAYLKQHQQICKELRIGQFMPSPQYAPYALRGVNLTAYHEKKVIFVCESWYECYKCHTVISYVTTGCRNCGATCIPNFKKVENE